MKGIESFINFVLTISSVAIILACMSLSKAFVMNNIWVILVGMFGLGLYVIYKVPKTRWIHLQEEKEVVGFCVATFMHILIYALICCVGFKHFKFYGANWEGCIVFITSLLLYGWGGYHIGSSIMCCAAAFVGTLWLTLEFDVRFEGFGYKIIDNIIATHCCIMGTLMMLGLTVFGKKKNVFGLAFVPLGAIAYFADVTLLGMMSNPIYGFTINFWIIITAYMIGICIGYAFENATIHVLGKICCVLYLVMRYCMIVVDDSMNVTWNILGTGLFIFVGARCVKMYNKTTCTYNDSLIEVCNFQSADFAKNMINQNQR